MISGLTLSSSEVAMTSLSHDEIQRRALRAAAKVALAMSTASVFGACGGVVQSTEEPTRDPQDHGGTVESGGATVVVEHPVTQQVIEKTSCDVTPGAATPTQMACCSAEVKATFPPDWTAPPDDKVPPGSADLVACCAEVVKEFDISNDLGLTFQQARACCFVLPGVWYEHGGLACTPWGPPMPRPMPWVDEQGEEQEDERGERVS
jgi:hypothetical protein